MRYSYQVGEKTFTQEKLVLGQIEHLVRRLQVGETFGLNVAGIVQMATKRFDVLACVLLPDGITRSALVDQLDEGQTTETERHLRHHLELETLTQMVTDFFDCNPMSCLSTAADAIRGKLETVLASPLKSNSNGSMRTSPRDGSETADSSELISPTPVRANG